MVLHVSFGPKLRSFRLLSALGLTLANVAVAACGSNEPSAGAPTAGATGSSGAAGSSGSGATGGSPAGTAGSNVGGSNAGSAGQAESAGSAGTDNSAHHVTVYTTSAAGDKLAEAALPDLAPAATDDAPVIAVDVATHRQAIIGFGGSFTESAAAVLAKLPADKRTAVVNAYFSASGADYTLTRTHIGSSDFSFGKYSYAETESTTLSDFTIAPDEDDLLPLIQDAQALSPDGFKIIASPWSAPPWMKTINDWYQPPSAANGYKGTGGKLKDEHRATFALYLSKYISAYEAKGVPIWAITPENEPLGNSGQWESLEFTASEMNVFIRDFLGPLFAKDHPQTQILAFDQNRPEAPEWAHAILGDPVTSPFVSGTAVHWYASTFRVYPDLLDQIHDAYPDKILLNSEATIDALRDEAREMNPPGDTSVPWGKATGELLYWKNDAWWWQKNASDWGYFWADGSAGTSPADQVDHPLYEPVYRYARDIIEGLNHWFVGWVDWNLVLDKLGGPNHVGNWAAAPIMVDTDNGDVYRTPLYYVMSHFSKFSRPGSHVVPTTVPSELPLNVTATVDEAGHVTLHVLNATDALYRYTVQLPNGMVTVPIGAATLQTVVID